ncbi:hypothetical protein SAMN05421803_107159 [Nocardiopsis flavescens]|uniref:Uncharacterized protein n=1 Tax=Nocardiopsis flavescens TaxID=758803 RepID=A0A1M6KG01_9ACTN|nr:hypothetical protein [Nocardiopsis flavescens]SHJ57858.1 hypothetical protein SAMN05421803_107159 [Nocardiopsis flavescens]
MADPQDVRKTAEGRVRNALLGARTVGGAERARVVLDQTPGLDERARQVAADAAQRVADLAAEGDWRAATDTAYGTAEQLAEQMADPEPPELSRAEVLARVQTSRGTAMARRAMAERGAARTVYAHGQKRRPTLPRKQ